MTASMTTESHTTRERPKATVAMPNRMTVANMMRPALRFSGLTASSTATASAPIAGAGAEQAEAPRAGIEHVAGEGRKERHGAAEEDGEEIERGGAEDDLLVSRGSGSRRRRVRQLGGSRSWRLVGLRHAGEQEGGSRQEDARRCRRATAAPSP